MIELVMQTMNVGAHKGNKRWAYTLTHYRKGGASKGMSRHVYWTRAAAMAAGRRRAARWQYNL